MRKYGLLTSHFARPFYLSLLFIFNIFNYVTGFLRENVFMILMFRIGSSSREESEMGLLCISSLQGGRFEQIIFSIHPEWGANE